LGPNVTRTGKKVMEIGYVHSVFTPCSMNTKQNSHLEVANRRFCLNGPLQMHYLAKDLTLHARSGSVQGSTEAQQDETINGVVRMCNNAKLQSQ